MIYQHNKIIIFFQANDNINNGNIFLTNENFKTQENNLTDNIIITSKDNHLPQPYDNYNNNLNINNNIQNTNNIIPVDITNSNNNIPSLASPL